MRSRSSNAADRAPVGLGSDGLAGWRTRRLVAAGFPASLARELAGDCGIDLHAVLELVERGCPPQLAARILAPLEEDRNPC